MTAVRIARFTWIHREEDAGWMVVDRDGNEFAFFPVHNTDMDLSMTDYFLAEEQAGRIVDDLNASGARRERTLREAAQ